MLASKFIDLVLSGKIPEKAIVFNKITKGITTLEWSENDKTYFTVYGVSLYDYFISKLDSGYRINDFELYLITEDNAEEYSCEE